MVKKGALDGLRASLCGGVLTPADTGYDEVRRIHNGMFVRRPAVIARCPGTADVVDAVRFARTHELELAVRGGGHSVAGKSVCEGGLMLDLSLMKGIYVDPGRRTVRAQGGVTWGEFNRETQLHGLATTGGVVSWFEYRLHPVGPVTSGLVAHPVERAREVLQFFREVTASVPDELTLNGGLLHAPRRLWSARGGDRRVSLRLARRGRGRDAADQAVQLTRDGHHRPGELRGHEHEDIRPRLSSRSEEPGSRASSRNSAMRRSMRSSRSSGCARPR